MYLAIAWPLVGPTYFGSPEESFEMLHKVNLDKSTSQPMPTRVFT